VRLNFEEALVALVEEYQDDEPGVDLISALEGQLQDLYARQSEEEGIR